jgi:hypothetical protein
VKFYGPRQALRLRDVDHKVTLLDEEVKIGDRTAVGVGVTGPLHKGKKMYFQRMYFDKETHPLLKGRSVVNREATFSDYKSFDGIPIAQKEGDGYLMPEVTAFEVDELDDKLFKQP